ncbi:MAG TPA: NAD(P)/FAD-dependent oxidoreductase, partial [Bryobacteraceae bacterium]|nr:NAD(P)/FAD-dependent oxidoreductase [Bryobacteraceae bacterium]
MNRRAFLAAAGAVFAPAATAQKVIIAGGGLAGLCCAHELRTRGFDVVVLEGQGRAGGRVQTLREGLDPELTAETGATRIPDTHHLTLSYVRELGLTLEPFKGGELTDVVHLRGRNYTLANGPEPDWPLQLRPDERRLGRKALAGRYLADPLKSAKGSENSPNVPEAILAIDRFTIREYLTQQGLSPDAIELITVGADTTISLALLLLVEFNEQVTREYFHIRGGNDQLPAALAKGLGGAIRYGCRVMSIGQNDRSAWAVIEHAGGRETIRGDYVISALPFSVARNLFADARLSSEKQRVIREQKYFPVDKVFLQMQKQFWKTKGQSGFANTDLLSERFWVLGPDSPDQRGLLLSYVIGAKAAKLDEMDVQSRVQATLADAERVFPGAREHFEAVRAKSWSQDPWQRGGLSAFGPG